MIASLLCSPVWVWVCVLMYMHGCGRVVSVCVDDQRWIRAFQAYKLMLLIPHTAEWLLWLQSDGLASWLRSKTVMLPRRL